MTAIDVGTRPGFSEGRSQAQFFRDDGSVFFTGTATLDNTTVTAAGLGADFSALLEANNVDCEFDMTTVVSMAFPESWQYADVTVQVSIDTPFDSTNGCVVDNCTARYVIDAAHTSGINPGVTDPADFVDEE